MSHCCLILSLGLPLLWGQRLKPLVWPAHFTLRSPALPVFLCPSPPSWQIMYYSSFQSLHMFCFFCLKYFLLHFLPYASHMSAFTFFEIHPKCCFLKNPHTKSEPQNILSLHSYYSSIAFIAFVIKWLILCCILFLKYEAKIIIHWGIIDIQ